MKWVKRGLKRGRGTVRGVAGPSAAAFEATSTSGRLKKRSDKLLCSRQVGQCSDSPRLSWKSWWPKGKPPMTAAKSTVSTSRPSECAERVEMSVLRVSMTLY